MRSRAYKNGGVFAPVEHHIQTFDDFYTEKARSIIIIIKKARISIR
jgi:hypothetical protein